MDDLVSNLTTLPPTQLRALTRTAYSNSMALLMARLSKLAYLHGEEERERKKSKKADSLEEELLKLGFRLVGSPIDELVTDTQAFLAQNDDYAVLAFRGTEANFRDILNDLNVKHAQTQNGDDGAMKGFLVPFKAVEKQISEALGQITPGKPIFITGHSLGAALATLATQSFEQKFFVDSCYTFGSPRVGTDALEQELKCSVYRVKNHRDIVTTVPLFTWNYQHVGSLYYMDAEGRMIRSPNIKILLRESTQAILSYFSGLPTILLKFWNFKKRASDPKLAPPAFRDHSIKAYLKKLGKLDEATTA